MTAAVSTINKGRRSIATPGEAENGRINFEKGHAIALQTFQEALSSGDVEIILLAEYLFVTHELADSEGDEMEGKASAEAALQSFDDAFLALKVVDNPAAYRGVEMAFPHRSQCRSQWRYKGLPRDAFHVAMIAHKTRLKNGISRLGLPKLDRELTKTRISALGAIQQVYCAKQHAVLGKESVKG
jgi:hypothetical protein